MSSAAAMSNAQLAAAQMRRMTGQNPIESFGIVGFDLVSVDSMVAGFKAVLTSPRAVLASPITMPTLPG